MMILTFTDIVQTLDIVLALKRTMRISPLRIKVLTSLHDLYAIQSVNNIYKNTPKYPYQVVIAPDAQNDIMSPINFVQSFFNSSGNIQLLKTELPDWDTSTAVTYY